MKELKKVGQILELRYGKALPKNARSADGKYAVYGANGIKTRGSKYLYDKPSIVVGRKGSAGEINFTEDKFWALDVTYFVVYNEKEYDLKYLYFLLKSLNLPSLARGIKPGINRNDVYALDVLVPGLTEQKVLVKRIQSISDSIQKLKVNSEKRLADLARLERSVLKDVFSQQL